MWLGEEESQSHGPARLNPVFIENFDILFILIAGRNLKTLQ